jgi:hypothetical protein
MKKLFSLLALVLSANAFAAAGFPQPAVVEKILNLGGAEGARKVQLGTQITRKKKQVMRAQYDYAKQGGLISTINLKDVDGKDAVLPSKSIITNVVIDVLTALGSGGSPTLALGANTTTDLKAATASSSYTSILAGIPVGTAATAVKTTAQRTLTTTIAVASVNAGKFDVFVEYYLGE